VSGRGPSVVGNLSAAGTLASTTESTLAGPTVVRPASTVSRSEPRPQRRTRVRRMDVFNRVGARPGPALDDWDGED